MITPEEVLGNFRTDRYADLNRIRWEHFLSMNLPLAGRTIFEPGAGVGDQTEWLLKQGPSQIWVNDGRRENISIIKERFAGDSRVTVLPPFDLESVSLLDFVPRVDFVFCYGVYYHLNDDFDSFHILRQLAEVGDIIALDYLAGNDGQATYGYDNPSTSLSGYACRPRPETLLQALSDIWGYAYIPRIQLKWKDPVAIETRLVAAASKYEIDNPNLLKFAPLLTKKQAECL